MKEAELRAFCEAQGVPVIEEGGRLRVMDRSLLPMTLRALCNMRGYFEPAEDLSMEQSEVPLARVKKPAVKKRASKK